MKKIIFLLFILFFIVVVLYLVYYFLIIKKEIIVLPVTDSKLQEGPVISEKTVDFSKINPEFLFSAEIPKEFEVEYISQLRAINIYNPILQRESTTEKSQIYIARFKASRFLTLNTVEITQQDKISINGKDATLYEITKKETVPNFAGQPLWRNVTHKAIDIRHLQDSPSYFYSFAQNPNLSKKIFDNFINSLVFIDRPTD